MQKALLITISLAILPCSVAFADEPVKPMTFDQYKDAVKVVDLNKHTISFSDFEKALGKKDTCVLDLREKHAYDLGHIKSARQLGPNITAQRLAELVPNKQTTIIVYCTNTLYPTRMMALTHVSLPQIVALGYPNTFVLEELWHTKIHKTEEFMDGPLWQKGKTPVK